MTIQLSTYTLYQFLTAAMNKYIYLVVLISLPLISSAQTIKSYISNDWPEERYQVHANGTVTDTITNLMCLQCSLGQDLENSCAGDAAEYDWQGALEAAESYTLGSYSDWRLPNIKELFSLVAHDRYHPAINSAVFPNIPAEDWHWSSSPNVYGSTDSSTLGLSLYYGSGNGSKFRFEHNYVRLVRSAQ